MNAVLFRAPFYTCFDSRFALAEGKGRAPLTARSLLVANSAALIAHAPGMFRAENKSAAAKTLVPTAAKYFWSQRRAREHQRSRSFHCTAEYAFNALCVSGVFARTQS